MLLGGLVNSLACPTSCEGEKPQWQYVLTAEERNEDSRQYMAKPTTML